MTNFKLNSLDLLIKNYFDSADAEFFKITDNKIRYPMDIIENDDGLLLQIACVGADLEDISITTTGDILNIKYTKKSEDSSIKWISRSITRKSFDLGYKVSSKYNLDNIKASLEKGLLSISLPLSEPKKLVSKKIEIVSK